MKNHTSGQTLTEFLVFCPILTLFIATIGSLLSTQWKRSKCAYLVFEKTHARLTGRPEPYHRERIDLKESQNGVMGTGYCGHWIEKVDLPRLEVAQW